MDFVCPADEAHGSHAIAVELKPAAGCLNDAGMIGQTQIIVGAEIQHAALCDLNLRLLRAQQPPLGFIQAFRTNVGQLLGGDLIQRRVSHGGTSR